MWDLLLALLFPFILAFLLVLLLTFGRADVLCLAKQLACHELRTGPVLATQKAGHGCVVGVLRGLAERGARHFGLVAQTVFDNL